MWRNARLLTRRAHASWRFETGDYRFQIKGRDKGSDEGSDE
jgi:hypothetical protein